VPTDVCIECEESEWVVALGRNLEDVGDELLQACDLGSRELSILLTDDPGIQELNSRWRGVDAPTDVLSFAFDEVEHKAEGMPLGDVILNLDRAESQRVHHGFSLEQELIYLLVHGVCHLRGFDHADSEESTLMKTEEERLLKHVSSDIHRPANFFEPS
jgi:probable rRNA maturation factor